MFDVQRICTDITHVFADYNDRRLPLYMATFIAYLSPIQNYIRWEDRFKKYGKSSATLAHLLDAMLEVARCKRVKPIHVKLLRILSRMETATSFVNADGIDLIFQILTSHPESTSIQIDCSAVIANLSNVARARTYIQERSTYLPTLLANMRKWAAEETVQTEMCAIISNLAQSEDNGCVIVRGGGFELIRRAMARHREAEDLHVQGLNAMAALAKNAKRLLAAGDVAEFTECVVAALEAWRESVQVCSAACNCIGMFSFVGLSVGSSVERAIWLAMRRFHASVKFQITACFALGHLVICLNKQTSMDRVLIDQLLKVIVTCPHNRNVLTTAIFALGSYALQSEENRFSIVEKGGVELIIKAMLETQFDEEANCLEVCMKHMSIHEGSHDSPQTNSTVASKLHLLKLFGSMCLMNISENEKCRLEVVHKGGIHAVFEAAKYIHETNNVDLNFVIMYVFRKVTATGARVYLKRTKMATLKTLCKNVFLKSANARFDAGKPPFESFSDYLPQSMQVTEIMTCFLSTYAVCCSCQYAFDEKSGVTAYEVFGKEKPVMTQLCSQTCLNNFADKPANKRLILVRPCFEDE
ncbi:armadillo-type protein [Chytriomyces sp. MP71]|nr:armadillo-type protein [Chytriomyces sp. MP71]